MTFFTDFYKYDEEAPEEGSKEWMEQYKQVEILGNKYDAYLKQIRDFLPFDFFDIYYDYFQLQGWDLNNLEFNHDIYNHPIIICTLTHTNINKVIILKYIDVKSFNSNLGEHYFKSYRYGSPGLIGVNEFILHKNILSHEIWFNTPESIKIYFSKLEILIEDKQYPE